MYRIIGADQKEYGPVTAEQIRQWVAEGRANGQTQVLPDGATEWKPLSALPEFAGVSGPGMTSPPFAPAPGPAWTPEELQWRDYDLDIGSCVSRAWQLVQAKFGLVVGAVAVFMLIQFAIGVAGIIPILGMLISLASLFVMGPFMGGLYYFFLKVIRGQPAELGDIFAGFRLCFVQLMLVYLVIMLIAGAFAVPGAVLLVLSVIKMVHAHQVDGGGLLLAVLGGLVICVPLLYFTVSWMFALPLVIDRQMEFWPAMQASRAMVGRHWWTVFALLLVCAGINLVGACACYVGLFISVPIVMAATMYAYEDIFGRLRPPLSRARAWNCLLVNQCGTPGLGSLMGRRIVAGSLELALAVVGFCCVTAWFIQLAFNAYREFSELPAGAPVYPWLGKAGGLLFAAAWLLSWMTSLSLLREARLNEPNQPPKINVPPRIT